MTILTIMPDHVSATITRIFRAAGAEPEEARAIADNLVGASIRGHDSHGIVRVPRYIEAAQNGHVSFGVHATAIIDSPGRTVCSSPVGWA